MPRGGARIHCASKVISLREYGHKVWNVKVPPVDGEKPIPPKVFDYWLHIANTFRPMHNLHTLSGLSLLAQQGIRRARIDEATTYLGNIGRTGPYQAVDEGESITTATQVSLAWCEGHATLQKPNESPQFSPLY